MTSYDTTGIYFYVEPWDHSTARFIWTFTEEAAEELNRYTSTGFPIQLCITRSASGTPVTPLDGVRVFFSDIEQDITQNVPSLTGRAVVGSDWDNTDDDEGTVFSNTIPFPVDVSAEMRAEDDPDIRPYAPFANIYDRNLEPGRTYYYTLFLQVPTDDPEGAFYVYLDENDQEVSEYRVWTSVASGHCRLPSRGSHKNHLYNLVPPYYRQVDQAALAGTSRTEGDLQRFLKITGFDLDWTKSMTEGIREVYDFDRVDERALIHVGEDNLGYDFRAPLGGIRYRSIISDLDFITNARGSEKGLRRYAQAASQYRTTVTGGSNRLRYANDAEFVDDVGMWTTDVATFRAIGGQGGNDFTLTVFPEWDDEPTMTLPDTPVAGFPNPRRTYVSLQGAADGGPVGMFYGMGSILTSEGDRFGRMTLQERNIANSAVPINPFDVLTFSTNVRRQGTGADPGPGFIVVGFTVVAALSDGSEVEVVTRKAKFFSSDEDWVAAFDSGIAEYRPTADNRTVAPTTYALTATVDVPMPLPSASHKLFVSPFVMFSNGSDEHHVSCNMLRVSSTIDSDLPVFIYTVGSDA